MDWTSLILGLINAGAAVMVAVLARNVSKKNKEDGKREELRREEARVSMQMIESTMDLSTACCNALCGGHNNGNVAEAQRKATAAREAYQRYQREVVAEVLR